MSDKVIYKYLSYEDALKTLENNSVVLNNPLNYNDPFDSVIDIDEKDEEKTIQLLMEVAFVKEIAKLLNRKDIKIKWYLKPIFWFDKTMINFILKITKKERKYTPIPTINSVINFILKLAEAQDINVAESIKELEMQFINDLLPKIKELRNKALVSCFSERNDSILMWGHYADKHKGVCIGYKKPEQYFYDIEYSFKRVKFPLYELSCIIASYLILDEIPVFNCEEILKKGLKPFLTKSKEWEYEKEVRCLFSLNDKKKFKNIDEGRYLYKMPSEVVEIYLGCKVTDEQKNRLLEIIKDKKVKMYQFIESKDKYELISVSCN